MKLLDLTPPYPPAAMEINAGIVRLVVARRDKKETRWGCFASRPLPEGAVVPDSVEPNVRDPEAVTKAAGELLQEAGTGSRAISLLISDGACRTQIMEFETLPSSRKELLELLRFRLKKTLSFPAEEARIAFTPLRPEATHQRLLVAASRDAIIAGYEAALSGLVRSVGLVDASTPNLLPVVDRLHGNGEAYLLLNVDDACFSVAIVRDGDLAFYRSKLFHDDAASRSAEALAKEVRLCHLYYTERLQGGDIGRVYLREAREGDPRLPHELQAEGNASVTPVDPLPLLPPDPEADIDVGAAPHAAPLVGMALLRGSILRR